LESVMTRNAEDIEAIISRAVNDPRAIAVNGGVSEAAADFMRNARARNEQRTPAERDASRRAACLRALASIREGR
jgi:hypothetical protein